MSLPFDQAVLDALMADYARQFPRATEFQTSSFNFEARMVLGRLQKIGATIDIPDPDPQDTP